MLSRARRAQRARSLHAADLDAPLGGRLLLLLHVLGTCLGAQGLHTLLWEGGGGKDSVKMVDALIFV